MKSFNKTTTLALAFLLVMSSTVLPAAKNMSWGDDRKRVAKNMNWDDKNGHKHIANLQWDKEDKKPKKKDITTTV